MTIGAPVERLSLVRAADAAPQAPAAAPTDATQAAAVAQRIHQVGADLLSGAAHYPEDIKELKAILALDPRSAESHLLLGIAYRGLGSADLVGETVAEFRQAIALNPAFVPPRFYLAQIYLDLGRAATSREVLEAGLVEVPGSPQFLALLGEAERRLKNPTRAVDLIRQALQADGSFAQARYYLGLALFDLGRRDEALGELEQVVRSGPNVADAYVNLGAMYLEAGRVDQAVETLSHGARVDPARPDLRVQLARAFRLKGLLLKADEQLAVAAARRAATPGSLSSQYQQLEFDLYLEQGLLRMQQGRLAAAAAALQKVLTIDPNHGPACRYLAEVYLLQGLYARALDYATRAEKLGFPLPDDKLELLEQKRRGAPTGIPR